MWSAFITGAATKAVDIIEERDKEIQEKLSLNLKAMEEEAKQTRKKGETRRDQLREAASQLIAFGMSPDQVNTLIANYGEDTLKVTIDTLKEQGGVRPEKAQQFLGETPAATGDLESTIARMTTPTVPERAVPATQMTGAFGLPSRAVGEFEERAKRLATELPEPAMPTTALDFGVFADEDKPKGVVELENKLADKAVDAGVSVEDFRKTEEGKKIQAQIDGRNALAAERRGTEEEKARSASQINTSIALRLRERFQPLEMGQILQWNPDQFGGGTYSVLLPNDPAAIKYQKDRLGVVRQYFIDTGLIDAKGNIKGGRNAADAMYPYAEIDYDPQNLRVKSWRDTPLVPEGGAAPQESKPEAPATGAGRSRIGARAAQPVAPIPPVPTGQQAAGSGLPAPKTEEEYNALPSGTTYRHPDGTTKIKP